MHYMRSALDELRVKNSMQHKARFLEPPPFTNMKKRGGNSLESGLRVIALKSYFTATFTLTVLPPLTPA